MEAQVVLTGTAASTLVLEFRCPAQGEEARASELAEQLGSLGWLGGLVQAGAAVGHWAEEPTEERVRRFEPEVRRVQFGSPLLILLAIDPSLSQDVSAAALLVYGLKYFWGLDLELKARREEQRARFYRARLDAEETQRKLQAFQQVSSEERAAIEKMAPEFQKSARGELRQQASAKARTLAEEKGWGRDVFSELEKKRPRRPWDPIEGTWEIED